MRLKIVTIKHFLYSLIYGIISAGIAFLKSLNYTCYPIVIIIIIIIIIIITIIITIIMIKIGDRYITLTCC